MDTTTATVIVVVILALLAVAAFIRFRQRGSAEVDTPFGKLKVDGSNDPPGQTTGIQARDILSRGGGIVADDATGRGVSAERLDAQDDVLLSSKNPDNNDPKAPPPE